MPRPKTAVIIGAGPAGLTAALELLEKTPDIRPVVLEADTQVGGLARTVLHNGNRMDIGGHRFFSKSPEVNAWWLRLLPPGEEGFQKRPRVSRILFLGKWFDYPLTLSRRTFSNMGLPRTLWAGAGYLWARLFPRKERSLEDFYINRFGRPLYRMFFEHYTQKVWGLHPRELGASWGSQRVKGLSVGAVLKDMLAKKSGKEGVGETSLIGEFLYPKFGPGQFWEKVAGEIVARGGTLLTGATVTALSVEGGKVTAVEYRPNEGGVKTLPCDYALSSMPVKDLVQALKDPEMPAVVSRIAQALPYRDFITVGLCVKRLALDGKVADTWIYIQERSVRVGRLQVFNNWSPALVKDPENTVWLGLEYFCSEGDALWELPPEEFIGMAKAEVEKLGIIHEEDVLDACHIRVKKAYPAYYGSYYQLDSVKAYLDGFSNLFCIGRNGQHRYNNMDHSMLTAIRAVEVIASGGNDKTAVWTVNSEKDYQE